MNGVLSFDTDSGMPSAKVDHSHRALLVDGRIHHGVGWLQPMARLCQQHFIWYVPDSRLTAVRASPRWYMNFDVGANGYFWGYDDARDLALRGMAPRGVTQVMM